MKSLMTIAAACVVLVLAASQASAWEGVESIAGGSWGDPNIWRDNWGAGGPDVPDTAGGSGEGAQLRDGHTVDVDGNYGIYLTQMFGTSTLNVPAGTSVTTDSTGDGIALGVWLPNGTSTLNITGGFASAITGDVTLAADSGNNAVLNISAGELSVGDELRVGRNGTATIQMDGGVIRTSALIWEQNGDTGSTMDIAGGQLVVNGDQRSMISALIGSAEITGLHGTTRPLMDYNNLNPGMTTVFVPEPAAFALILAGALLIPRRRR